MNYSRAALGAVVSALGVRILSRLIRPNTRISICEALEIKDPSSDKSVGRRRSTVAAQSIYNFTPDTFARDVHVSSVDILDDDNQVTGVLLLKSPSRVTDRTCGTCRSFILGACPSIVQRRLRELDPKEAAFGVCTELAEATTTRGGCDLWTAREKD